MVSGERAGNNQARFYVWQAPDNSIAVQLNLKLVEALTAEHFRATEEGLEHGVRGVLLGRSICVPRPATFVEDFALIPETQGGRIVAGIGKQAGPFLMSLLERLSPDEDQATSLASDDDLAQIVSRLHRGVERGRNAIGFFRSQWDGDLVPTRRDLKIVNRLFSQPEDVMLLVRFSRRGEAEAAFFHWQNGKLQTPGFEHTFPFDLGKLSRRATVKRHDGSALPGWPRTPNLEPRPSLAKEAIRWWQLLPTVALFTVGTLAIQTSLEARSGTPVTVAGIAARSETALGLKVTLVANKLEIRWKHNSKAIQSAERAVMKISEPGALATEVVPIDKRQLLTGYVAYTPLTNDISIQFDVKESDGSTTTESVSVEAAAGTK